MSLRTVERSDDPISRLQGMKRRLRWTIVVGIAILCAQFGYLALTTGWKVAVGAALVVAVFFDLWSRIEAALANGRMRKLMKSGGFALDQGVGPPVTGAIDSWLLLRGGYRAVAVDRAANLMWFFASPKVAHSFPLSAIRRAERQRVRGWLGRHADLLRLSDSFAGPWLSFAVIEGDVARFAQNFAKPREFASNASELPH
jgi:hypothetical protein